MHYLRLVNQHLSSARLLLAELACRDTASKSLRRAYEQAILQLLNSTYLCQLRNIADSYLCANIASIADIQALLAALAAIDKPAPEAAEIEVLMGEGWLGELYVAWQQLSLPAPVKTVASQSDITLHDGSEGLAATDADALQRWLNALEELVQRHSEMMAEY